MRRISGPPRSPDCHQAAAKIAASRRRSAHLEITGFRSCTLSAALAIVLISLATPVAAEVPLSIGTQGAAQRASLLANANRNGSAASFGSPQPQSESDVGLRWRVPLLLVGGDSPVGFIDSRSIPAWSWTPAGTAFAFEPNEFLSALIPQISIGRANQPFHLQAGVISGDMGHGTLVSQFTNSPEGSARRAGFLLAGNTMGGGFEFLLGDVFDAGSFVAARAHARPMVLLFAPDAAFQPNDQWFDLRSKTLGLWKSGIGFALDAHAPLDSRPVPRGTAMVSGFTWDNELELLNTSAVQLQLNVDANLLSGSAGGEGLGTGLHVGIQSGFDLFGLKLSGTGEYRTGSDGYIPRYFDRLYMVERQQLLSGNQPKAAIGAPASHGYFLRGNAGLGDYLSLYMEASDLFAYDTSSFANNGQITVGMATWLWLAGFNLTLTQTGIQEYLKPNLGGPGFVALGEVRASLIGSWVYVVGRYWRIHQPNGASTGPGYNVDEGALIGFETNFNPFS